jgi:hypothetical protein
MENGAKLWGRCATMGSLLIAFLVMDSVSSADDCANIDKAWQNLVREAADAGRKDGPEERAFYNHFEQLQGWYLSYIRQVWLFPEGTKPVKCPDVDPVVFIINRFIEVHTGKMSVQEFWQGWKEHTYGELLFVVLARLDWIIGSDEKLKVELGERYCEYFVPNRDSLPRTTNASCLPYYQFMDKVLNSLTSKNSAAIEILISIERNNDGHYGEELWEQLRFILRKHPEAVIGQIALFRELKETLTFVYCEYSFDEEQMAIREAFAPFNGKPEAKEILSWFECPEEEESESVKIKPAPPIASWRADCCQYAQRILIDRKPETAPKFTGPIAFIIDRYDGLVSGKGTFEQFIKEWRDHNFGYSLDDTFWAFDDAISRDLDVQNAFAQKYWPPYKPEANGTKKYLGPACLPYAQFIRALSERLSKEPAGVVAVMIELYPRDDFSEFEEILPLFEVLFEKHPKLVISQIEQLSEMESQLKSFLCGEISLGKQKRIRTAFKPFANTPEGKRVLSWLEREVTAVHRPETRD